MNEPNETTTEAAAILHRQTQCALTDRGTFYLKSLSEEPLKSTPENQACFTQQLDRCAGLSMQVWSEPLVFSLT